MQTHKIIARENVCRWKIRTSLTDFEGNVLVSSGVPLMYSGGSHTGGKWLADLPSVLLSLIIHLQHKVLIGPPSAPIPAGRLVSGRWLAV